MFKITGYLPRLTVTTAERVLMEYKGRIIDIACGNGPLLRELHQHKNKSAVGIDINPNQIAQAQAAGVNAILGDMFSMPFPDETFDASVCLNAIYNFSSLRELGPAFREMIRLVKKDGRLLIDVRNKRNPFIRIKYWLHNKKKLFQTNPYTPDDLETAMKAVGGRLVTKYAIGINNPFLAWGYILVFEKENSNS